MTELWPTAQITLVVDRIDAFADSLTSAATVYSRPEAQAEYDKLRQATRVFSRRWGTTLLLAGAATVATAAATGQYLAGRPLGYYGTMVTQAAIDGWCLVMTISRRYHIHS